MNDRIDGSVKRRVALKWANVEPMTSYELRVWAEMLRTPPQVDQPRQEDMVAIQAVIEQTLSQYKLVN
jgi:DNA-directed RNA polymerase subunit F